jgi:hypothetical protein
MRGCVAFVVVAMLVFMLIPGVAVAQCQGGVCPPQQGGWGGQPQTSYRIQYPTPVRSFLFGSAVVPQSQPQYQQPAYRQRSVYVPQSVYVIVR